MKPQARCLAVMALWLTAPVCSAVEVYVIPFSHLDLFWGGTREECLARGNRIISKAIELAKRRPDFRFLLEDNVFVANYVDSHSGSAELEDLKRLVKEGRIEIAPKWAAIYQNLPRGEALSRNLVYGKRYARAVFGVDPQVAHLGDLPGYTPQFPQILARSATPFMVMTRMGPLDRSLFRWRSADGSTALVWHAIKGYHWAAQAGLHQELDGKRLAALNKDLEEVSATTSGPVFMNWGIDLWAPAEKLIDNVGALNKSAGAARFRLATPAEFFRAASQTSGIPEISGEIPSAWANILSSMGHIWPPAFSATDALLTAEKFAAINYALGYAAYPEREFEFLWKKLLEAMDHNNDGQGGDIGDERKISYSRLAALHAGEIQRDMLRNIAERVAIPIRKSHPIVVFNPLGWKRDDVVQAHVTLYGDVAPSDLAEYRKGMRLVDEAGNAVPFHLVQYSENISRALELVFVAQQVPSLGYRTYFLVPAERPETFPPVSELRLDSENDRKEPRRAMQADVVENEFYRVSVDKATGRMTVFDKALGRMVARDMEIVAVEERGGNSVGVEPVTGRTLFNSIESVAVEENNAVRTVIRIGGQIAGVPIAQKATLYRGLKRLDLENTVEWKGGRFLKLEQRFPYEHSSAEIRYGIPFGSWSAADLLPNSGPHFRDEITKDSWRQSRQIQDWIFAGNSDWGLTISADRQLMTLGPGVIRAGMLRGVRFSSVRVQRGDTATSLEFPPPGTYVFRYALTTGAGDWKAARSCQTGMGFNNPLIPVAVVDEIARKSLPPAHSFCSFEADNLVISALKKSDLDAAVLLRVFEINGSATRTPVVFLGEQRRFREVNLLEEGTASGDRELLNVNPYEIRTIALDPKR